MSARRLQAVRQAAPASNDLETRGAQSDHSDLRLWLRILAFHKLVNNEVRRRLRDEFDMSLSRFDLLAQLDDAPDGMRMGEISRRLMVTSGNITGLTDELEAEGLVERFVDPANRRAFLVRMTAKGEAAFQAAAAANQIWIEDFFSGLSARDKSSMFGLLGRLKDFALIRIADAAPAAQAVGRAKTRTSGAR
ncbi:MAG: MarR family transcriptional regulator [Hyphomicrobiales bacterium]|nr:MarR family transcriptional regulator [Hyphomicrobiales bacterium]